MELRRDYYVYMYYRLGDVPCYVGKGRNGRWLEHLSWTHNPRLRAIINKEREHIRVVKFMEGLTEFEAFFHERRIIMLYGRGKNGPLVNFTDGGEGMSGFVYSDESKAKMRESHLGKVLPEE